MGYRSSLYKVCNVIKSIKTSEYLSCGTDHDESGRFYCYLQTAHDNEEDIELFATNNLFSAVAVGKLLCFFFRKRLVRW